MDVRRKKSRPPMHLTNPLPPLAQGTVGIIDCNLDDPAR